MGQKATETPQTYSDIKLDVVERCSGRGVRGVSKELQNGY